MKIQCDVCDKDKASVFCVADEAALCSACDHRVHHANKLAGKHLRFSFLHPSPKQVPLCDICKERRAFLFCQQDRAILCKECDISIHKANEHTQKHNRFLLTGVKLSATSSLYSSASQSSGESASSSEINNNLSDGFPNIRPQESRNKSCISAPPSSTPLTAKSITVTSRAAHVSAAPEPCYNKTSDNNSQLINGGNFNSPISMSSISEYLIEMLPGWHVEDFLDSASPFPYGFSKSGEDNDVNPFWKAGIESNMSGIPTEHYGSWVPQAPPPPLPQTRNQLFQSMEMNMIAFGASNGTIKEHQSKEFSFDKKITCSMKWNEENSFTVPQITPPSNASKRSRTFR